MGRRSPFWLGLLVVLGCLMNLAAWFLPTLYSSPGYFAFWVALHALHPLSLLEGRHTLRLLASGLSALSNILVPGAAYAMWSGSARLRGGIGWGCFVAFCLNGWWFIDALWMSYFADNTQMHYSPGDLRLGYYLWWGSFAVLAGGLLACPGGSPLVEAPRQARAREDAPPEVLCYLCGKRLKPAEHSGRVCTACRA